MFTMFILGIGIIALGIFALRHSKRMYKLGKNLALVHDCQDSDVQVLAKNLPGYEVTFEIQTPNGVIYRSIKDNQSYNVGEYVEIFYDPQTDKVELPKNVSPANSKGPYAIIGFGVMLCVLAVLFTAAQFSSALKDGLMTFFTFFLLVALLGGGAYASIIRPGKRKKAMGNCHTVEGILVDYKRTRRKRNRSNYTPIYAFYHNNQQMRIEGEVSGNGSKYRQIGRKVTIVINDVTGEKYCLEDMKEGKKVGYIIIAFGLVLAALVIGSDFFGGSNNSSDSSYVFDFNNSGYSTEPVNLPADEYYSEYNYMPTDMTANYAYNIKIYDYGIGVVTIFPTESTGKDFHQSFSFKLSYKNLKPVVDDTDKYDFEQLAGETGTSEGAESNEYVYYYNGKERVGSGGYDVDSDSFDSVVQHIKDCVPDEVWNAIEQEMQAYYE